MWLTNGCMSQWQISSKTGHSVLSMASLKSLDTSPECKFLEDIALDHPIARHFTVGISYAQNGGEYVVSDATLHIAKEFIDYILASSAIPAVFLFKKYEIICILIEG